MIFGGKYAQSLIAHECLYCIYVCHESYARIRRSIHQASTPDVLSGGPALGLDYRVLCYG